MADSKYESSRSFELPDILLPSAWIVIRIDGRGFHRFSTRHNFTKPNDKNALDLMNAAATVVVAALPDIRIAYGMSDEYSFVFHKKTSLFGRRQTKLVSTVVSMFTAEYVYRWKEFMAGDLRGENGIGDLPSFDGRAVMYPSLEDLRDYFKWRQVDCHVNNLYNTCFWALVKGGMTTKEAEKKLQGTTSADKNEILFSQFGINYNNEPEIFKKGSVIFREHQSPAVMLGNGGTEAQVNLSKAQLKKQQRGGGKAIVAVGHYGIIKDAFWDMRPWILLQQ